MKQGCIFDSPITDDEIDRLLDGEEDPVLISHLKQCPSCHARFLDARQFELALMAHVHRQHCPSPQVIAQFALRPSTNEAFGSLDEIEQHVQACPKCQADVQLARTFLRPEDTRKPLPTPPIIHMPQRPTAAQVPLPRTERITLPRSRNHPGTLTKNTGGFRKSAPRGRDAVDDLVQIGKVRVRFHTRTRQGSTLSIFGQILDDEASDIWEDTLVRVYARGMIVAVVPLDELCEFRCKVDAETVSLSFSAKDGRAIIIDGVCALEDLT
jgi:hypothetical protein